MQIKKRSTGSGAALLILLILGIVAGFCMAAVWTGLQQAEPLLRLPHRPAGTKGDADLPAGPAVQTPLKLTEADLASVSVRYASDCSYRPNLAALLDSPLPWNLTGNAPTVLIVHSHGTESFTKEPGQAYTESSEFRTLDTGYNMVALGDQLALLLRQRGIEVIHDRQLHDYPSYGSAYDNSRNSVQAILQQYPTIQVVLDLHRDAVLNSDGSQYAPTVLLDGQQAAKLMLVVGTDASGLEHSGWEENMAAAVKLQAALERIAPGVTRPTILRAQRFNHDLSPGALIVEVGTAGNTFQQAQLVLPVLADGLALLMNGT